MDYLVVNPKPIDQALPDLYLRTQHLHRQLSEDMAQALSRHFNFSVSDRYWDILIGPWLRSCCDNVVRRWAYLNQAIDEFGVTESYTTIDHSDFSNRPHNLLEYRNLLKRQSWNQYMYSTMWDLMTNSHFSSLPQVPGSEFREVARDPISQKHPTPRKRAVLADTYLPRVSEIVLTMLLGSRPKSTPRVEPPSAIFDPDLRTRLSFDDPPLDQLHAIGREIVRDQIPTSYFEGLPVLRESTRQLRLPDAPEIIFTSNRHLYDDVFNAWVAQATEHGSKYVIGQHGGFYGLSRFPSYAELHEEDVSDANITWGWGRSKKQLPGICLTTVGRKSKPSKRAKHLLIVCDHMWTEPRSLFFDISEHVNYLEYVTSCAIGLPPEISKSVVVRLNHAHAETGSSQLDWWKTHAPSVNVDNGLVRIQEIIRESRLVVSTYNGTTFLETLNLNIPTLITWSNSYIQVRDESLPYFQQLESAGIFHNTERSFIEHVTKNWNNIESWWASDTVQSARLAFCNQFSGFRTHPLLFLRKTLNSLNTTENCLP